MQTFSRESKTICEAPKTAKTSPIPEDRRSDLPKYGKHQVSIMIWVKDIEAEAKTRGLDAMFYVDENIRNAGGSVANVRSTGLAKKKPGSGFCICGNSKI